MTIAAAKAGCRIAAGAAAAGGGGGGAGCCGAPGGDGREEEGAVETLVVLAACPSPPPFKSAPELGAAAAGRNDGAPRAGAEDAATAGGGRDDGFASVKLKIRRLLGRFRPKLLLPLLLLLALLKELPLPSSRLKAADSANRSAGGNGCLRRPRGLGPLVNRASSRL